MKKIIALTSLVCLLMGGSAFAASNGHEVPATVITGFNQLFNQAKDVTWETGKDFFKATFDWNGRTLFAFYADNGDLMGVATNLSAAVIPGNLRADIRKNYSGYWITDLFGYRNDQEQALVITLENADKKIILKSTGGESWSVYRTTLK